MAMPSRQTSILPCSLQTTLTWCSDLQIPEGRSGWLPRHHQILQGNSQAQGPIRTLRGQTHKTGLSTNKLEVVFLSQTAPLATVNMLLKAALPVIQALATLQAQDSAPSVPETLDTASPPQKPKSFKSITSHLC